MPNFSKRSEKALSECDNKIKAVMYALIEHVDFSVTCGHRGKEEQNKAYRNGFSKLKWPESKHNSLPSKAVDIYPYPYRQDYSIEEWTAFCNYVVGFARGMGVNLWNLGLNHGWDYPHFEVDRETK